jgi:hypothetical protein
MSAPIPVFSERPKAVSTPKLRALVKFPGNVEATTGISVEKINGTWTFETDWSQFGTLTTFPTSPTNYVLTYDTLTQNYLLVPSAAVAGVIEAPANHILYGRKDNGWSQAVSISGDTMSGALIIASTAGGTGGVLYLGNLGSSYLQYTGSEYILAGGMLTISSHLSLLNNQKIKFATNGTGNEAYLIMETGNVFSAVGGSNGFAWYNNSVAGIMTLNSGGALRLGTGSAHAASAKIAVDYAGTTQYGMTLRPASDTTPVIAFINVANSVVGSITQTASATAYNTSSDIRLKENLQSFDAGRIVDDTEVYSFTWKSTGERSYGVSAQQANEVYPEAVTYIEREDWWGINYQAYVPILLQELKALRARVAELEERLSSKPS